MANEFQNILDLSLSIGTVIENLVVALICSLIIASIYKFTYKGPGFSISYINSLVILSMITSIVIMVIGNNLARAFGLVGAMSIIRFRTPIKDAVDIVYIFFALAIGMAAGVGLHMIAFGGTIIIGLVIIFLVKTGLFSLKKQKYLLQFHYISTDHQEEALYLPVIKKFCRSYSLLNVKDSGKENGFELSYYVDLKDRKHNNLFLSELKVIEGISKINLYHNEDEL